ncbi:MAG: S41 family peptidase [Myxococcota bacterium]
MGGRAAISKMTAKTCRPLLTLCLAAAWTAVTAVDASGSPDCTAVPKLMHRYFDNHVQHRRVSSNIEQRTVDNLIRRFDPSRSALRADEVESLQKSQKGMFERIRAGDCAQLKELHQTFVTRHRKVEVMVREIVGSPDYQVDWTVELVLDPEQRGHPTTEAQREEIIRSLVHFQMSNYLSGDTPLEEAKKNLIHRYELRTKRVADLEEEDLFAAFLDAFASSLDPHSGYLSAEVLEDFRISMSLSLEGIGVALSERDGYAVVERIIPGGAADRHNGLKPKDKIIAVAQEEGESISIIDMPLRDAVSLIRGKKGSPVHLTILRQGERAERFTVTIVRDKINLEEQAAKLRFVEREAGGEKYKLAILELPSFYGDVGAGKRQCSDDVAELLRKVKEAKADGLLLDLSRNGGGLLEQAVTISGFFVRKGEIVGIENAKGQRQILSDRDEGILYSGPMVVHTSRVSASAAEILAGAMKDYERAVIAGDDHTFGKGTVQTVSPLPPGEGALRITTALFFRPGGKSTQNDGVKADVVIPSLLSGDDFGEKNHRYALLGQQVPPFLSSFANANGLDPAERWKPVTPEVMGALAQRSRQRIQTSSDFDEIRKKIDERSASNGSISLADIRKQRQEAKAANGDADAAQDSDEETNTPQLEEALTVLVDLVELTG